MGLFNRETDCPVCGDRQARKPLFGAVKCPNYQCENFHADLLWQLGQEGRRDLSQELPERSYFYAHPRTGERILKVRPCDFEAGPVRIDIHYRNSRGDQRTFIGDRRTLRDRGSFVSVCVEDTGMRIALRREAIDNRDEVEAALAALPTRIERQILGYHTKNRTTSPRYEQVRAKYPDW